MPSIAAGPYQVRVQNVDSKSSNNLSFTVRPPPSQFIRGDVSSKADTERMVATALERFGGLDILFNNAGVGIRKPIHEYTDEEWDYVVNTNLRGVFNGVRAALPHFRGGGGNIVNMASSHGILAAENYAAYCATKAAIVNLTRQLAIDYGPAVRVNCVCPGPSDTPLFRNEFAAASPKLADSLKRVIPWGRLGVPDDIAPTVVFLASDEAGFITGQTLSVSGGLTMA